MKSQWEIFNLENQIAINNYFFMLFLMEVKKIEDFYQLGLSGSKAAPPIGLHNGLNLRFYRYLHDPVVNFSFHSILSIFKLII